MKIRGGSTCALRRLLLPSLSVGVVSLQVPRPTERANHWIITFKHLPSSMLREIDATQSGLATWFGQASPQQPELYVSQVHTEPNKASMQASFNLYGNAKAWSF